jgi:Predicted membrane protein
MNDRPSQHSVPLKLEKIVLATLQVLLFAVVIVATIILCFLFVRGLILVVPHTTSVDALREVLDKTFGGVLIVFLGLELLETFKVYFQEREIRLEAVIVVAVIAVGRHVVEIDLEHTPGFVLLGIAALLLSLAFGYFLIKRSLRSQPEEAVKAT